MSLDLLRLLERVHGHVAWLSIAALLHPAILLRNPKRRAPLSVSLAASLALATGLLGGFLYPEYTARLKQAIFIHTPTIGWCFERKEHLAVGAIGLAIAGAIAHLAAPRFDEPSREHLARAAHRAFIASFVFALIAGGFGVGVATVGSF